jgi:hypothetical protein
MLRAGDHDEGILCGRMAQDCAGTRRMRAKIEEGEGKKEGNSHFTGQIACFIFGKMES